MTDYTHSERLCGRLGLGVGEPGAEITTADSDGHLFQGGVELTPAAAEINKLSGAPLHATMAVGAETSNAITVSVQLQNGSGVDLAVRGSTVSYLSDDANGDSVIATVPSGGVAAGTDGVIIPVVVGKAFILISEADGDIDVVITEAGVKTCYLILVMPTGKLIASGAITFA